MYIRKSLRDTTGYDGDENKSKIVQPNVSELSYSYVKVK